MNLSSIGVQTNLLQIGPMDQFGLSGPQSTDFMAVFGNQSLEGIGRQLMQQGDFQQGMQLVREGARLEQQGAKLETQGANGTDPGNQTGSNNPTGGNDPTNGQYGSSDPNRRSGVDLSVNGGDNTVNTGRYTIKASKDNGGTLTVTDNMTGQSF